MKIPVLEIGDKEKTDFVILKKNTGVGLILRYNLDELLELARVRGKR